MIISCRKSETIQQCTKSGDLVDYDAVKLTNGFIGDPLIRIGFAL